MPKLQQYEITFAIEQSDPFAAMYSIGQTLSSLRDITMSGILTGDITEETATLSEDGLTLNVSRLWADSSYQLLMTMTSESEIRSSIENLDHVSSVVYGFSDA